MGYCNHENCKKYASFGYIVQQPTHCKEHSTSDMIDVKNKRCKYNNCIKQPTFGFIGQQAQYCKQHATPDMLDLKHKRCIYQDCNIRPNFGYINQKAQYCKKHMLQGMIDLRHKQCESCQFVRQNVKYEPYCTRCYIYKNPDQQLSKNFKVKERYVTDFIKQQYSEEYKIQFDDIIQDGCSQRRPDVLFRLPLLNIIIECDENQHKDYDTTCEISRLNNIYEDLGMMPLIIVRFNPDKYTENGIKYNSCFKLHKTTGILVQRLQKDINHQNEDINYRLQILKETIDQLIDVIPDQQIFVQTKYLFFDK